MLIWQIFYNKINRENHWQKSCNRTGNPRVTGSDFLGTDREQPVETLYLLFYFRSATNRSYIRTHLARGIFLHRSNIYY